MAIDEKRKRRPIARLLGAAALDLDAARRLLLAPPNLLAANHLQQAAGSRTKACSSMSRGRQKTAAREDAAGFPHSTKVAFVGMLCQVACACSNCQASQLMSI